MSNKYMPDVYCKVRQPDNRLLYGRKLFQRSFKNGKKYMLS